MMETIYWNRNIVLEGHDLITAGTFPKVSLRTSSTQDAVLTTPKMGLHTKKSHQIPDETIHQFVS